MRDFVYEQAPFPECHASTIAETSQGLVVAWFGGTHERHSDVGIWLARQKKGREVWTPPVEVANGVQPDGKRHPTWNPVLFQASKGPLLLFYKVGPSPRSWWGMWRSSRDLGETWSAGVRLPEGILGPIKNKPLELEDGTILCGSSTEHQGWRVHMEWTADGGTTWHRSEPLNDGREFGAIQPTILAHGDALQILCRARGVSGGNRILEARSSDRGRTWTALAPTSLPNPNSGIDAVTLRDGRRLLVYNHTARGRTPLNIAIGEKGGDGKAWQAALTLEDEPGEYSYPAVIQSRDGLVHATYTWKRRRVRHVVIDPAKLVLRPIVDGRWPE